MFEKALGDSIIGRAVKAGIIDISYTNIRDYSVNKHHKTDDYPYGGGTGLVMTAQPIFDAWQAAAGKYDVVPHTIYMSPQGNVFDQHKAFELKAHDNLIILCGHYEGIDERVIEEIVDEEISLGDFVLTGGEIPAMALVDAVSRLIPGVLPESAAYEIESHANGLLEYPQYTRPEVFRGKSVPDILLSGHHANIEKWRNEQSIERTKNKRPDLYKKLKRN